MHDVFIIVLASYCMLQGITPTPNLQVRYEHHIKPRRKEAKLYSIARRYGTCFKKYIRILTYLILAYGKRTLYKIIWNSIQLL